MRRIFAHLKETEVVVAKKSGTGGRTLDDVMATLPAPRRQAIETSVAATVREIEGLKALRQLTRHSQEQIAQSLGVKQPSVLKIERQTDLYLSTLRRFVEAAGGKLELRVELPGSEPILLMGLGEIRVDKVP
jgi:DNA-binding XRE family transcriptional regulator